MGERQGWLFEPTFNKTVKIRCADSGITSNAGALLLREADHRLGLTSHLADQLHDNRNPDYIRYTTTELLSQYLYSQSLGYSHQDDADYLAHDPAMKMAVWNRRGDKIINQRLSSQPSMWRMINRFSSKHNRNVLRKSLSQSICRHQTVSAGRKVRRGTIDIDPFPIEVHGKQPGKAYHGHYHQNMYYPAVAGFSVDGNYDSAKAGNGFVHAILRRGNCGGAEGVARLAINTIKKSRDLAQYLDVRIDAGLTQGDVLDAIDDQNVQFTGRIKKNKVLDKMAQPYLSRSPGRPTQQGDQFAIDIGTYKAKAWTKPYRLILVIIDLPNSKTGLRELFPRYFFLITNFSVQQRSPEQLLQHYRQRGTYEDRYAEFNNVIGSSLSADSFEENEVILLLKLLAFNLITILRFEMESASGNGWDLGRLQKTVLKTGGKISKHSGRLIVDIAHAAGSLWHRLLKRIGQWSMDLEHTPSKGTWVPPPSHAHLCLVLRE